MNHHKLTQRNLEIDLRSSKFHILLLVSFILLLAVPGFAQVTGRLKEQTESFSETLQSEEQAKDQDRRRPTLRFGKPSRFDSLWTRFIEGEEKPVEVSVPTDATKYLFTKQMRPEVTGSGSRGSSFQPASDLSRFAVFGTAGVAFAHGDFSTFADPGFSINTGLEYMITDQFSAEATLGYNRFPTFFSSHLNLYQLSGNAKFYLVDESSNVRPFVNGGLGAYVAEVTAHFGGNIGGGILYQVTPHFGIQGSYNFHAFSAGSVVRYSTAQGGVRWRF
jgi:hypothetical protein